MAPTVECVSVSNVCELHSENTLPQTEKRRGSTVSEKMFEKKA